MAGVIDSYLDDLARHLDADPALARRVRAEFANHLAEALDGTPGDEEAARRAVARMGPAGDIAAAFMADGAARQAERTWWVMLAAFLATFIAMRMRGLWLPVPDGADASLALTLAPLVDRWGFVATMAAGLGGYCLARHVGRRDGRPQRPLGFALAAAIVAGTALAASVVAGLLRVGLGGDWLAAPLLVAAATLGELALVGCLLAQIRALGRRTRRIRAIPTG